MRASSAHGRWEQRNAGFGDGHQLSNFGLIETHGTFAFGIGARGWWPTEPGLDFEIVNAGRIATDGDLAIGVALGLAALGFLTLRTARSTILA